jgi:lipoyl-dependent peroxiredoxin subunit C
MATPIARRSAAVLLTVGDQFPRLPSDRCRRRRLHRQGPGRGVRGHRLAGEKGGIGGVFFWPKDFTFVCPTEIAAFGKLNEEFQDRDTQVPGVSVDNEFVHRAWRLDHKDLRELPFPMVADAKRELTAACGVLNADGVADRATFIIDPNNEVQFVMVTAGSVGRNVDEVLRVLDALQTDELCPCNWKAGDETLVVRELLNA